MYMVIMLQVKPWWECSSLAPPPVCHPSQCQVRAARPCSTPQSQGWQRRTLHEALMLPAVTQSAGRPLKALILVTQHLGRV